MRRDGIPESAAGDPWVWPDGSSLKYDAWEVLAWLEDPDTGEPYVFLTFVVNALRWSGLGDVGVDMFIRDFNRGRNDQRRLVCGKVRRYIRACLGYASS